jgi:uncharacterized protein (TIGR03435 family)
MRWFLVAFAATLAFPQTEFEAASVKPTPPESTDQRIEVQPGGRFRATNITLKGLLRMAYDVKGFQISGGPKWIDSTRYDVEAKAAGNPNAAERLVMMQVMLADRFQLKLHRESRELPVYWLVVGKGGPKIQRAADDTRSYRVTRGVVNTRTTIPALANVFSNWLERVVLDRTGLEGAYEVKLEWIPEEEPESANHPGASLFSAVQEQLGLKLEARKGPVDILVIDGAEKPSEN